MEEDLVGTFAASADDSSSTIEDKEEDFEAAYKNFEFRSVKGEAHAGPIEFIATAHADDTLRGNSIPSGRYSGKKPVYVWANIIKSHLNTGEDTGKCKNLGDIIRGRGKTSGRYPDACGHVISRRLGGRMVDYNLFPQAPPINSGWMGNSVLWTTIEFAAATWLSVIPASLNPRVQFSMLLQYDDSSYKDRPDKFKYLIKFFITRKKKDGEENKKYEFSREVINVAKKLIRCAKTDFNLRQQIMAIIKAENLNEGDLGETMSLLAELEKLLADIAVKPKPDSTPKPRVPDPCPGPSPNVRQTLISRDLSVVDFIPVVGSVKGILAGSEDIVDGHIIQGVANIAMNGIFLGMDLFTLGAASSVIKGGAKVATKVAAKKSVEVVAKEVLKKEAVGLCKTAAGIGAEVLVRKALSRP